MAFLALAVMPASPPDHLTSAIAGTRWDELGGTFEAAVVRPAGAPGETRLQLQGVRTPPRTSCHGTMGCAWADDGQGMRRIHVCAHSPCTLSDDFGNFIEFPIHVRRVLVGSGASASEDSPIGEPRTEARSV